MRNPKISSATLKETFKFKRHTAKLFTDCKSDGLIQYHHILLIIPNGQLEPVLAVTSETNFSAKSHFNDPFLCTFQGGVHSNFGSDPAYKHVDTFAIKAREVACKLLNESEQ